MRPVNVHGLAGLLGAVAFASSLVVLHSLRPEIDWLRHYVSDFANGRLGWVFVVATALHGLGNLALDAGLRRSLEPGPLRAAAVLLFGLAASGIVVAALVPADAAGSAPTLAGRVHLLAAALSFLLEVLALFLFSAAFARNPAWHIYIGWSFTWSVVATAAVAGLFLAALWDRIPGLAERLALGSLVLWEAAASLALLRRGRTKEPRCRRRSGRPPDTIAVAPLRRVVDPCEERGPVPACEEDRSPPSPCGGRATGVPA